MDKPKCDICGVETQWYGWLHGWLCVACNAEELEEEEDEPEPVKQQQPERPKNRDIKAKY